METQAQIQGNAETEIQSSPPPQPTVKSPIELIETSFEKIKPSGAEFAASFYENLFAAYPEAKPLFANTDIKNQEKKLLNSLVLVVASLRNPEALAEVLRALGARHVTALLLIDEPHRHNQNPVGANGHSPLLWSTVQEKRCNYGTLPQH